MVYTIDEIKQLMNHMSALNIRAVEVGELKLLNSDEAIALRAGLYAQKKQQTPPIDEDDELKFWSAG